MKIDKAGTYTFIYTAVDECGNETTETRQVVVNETYRTVLYEDGTFIINERGSDKVRNTDLYGTVVAEYVALNADNPYVFSSADEQPWSMERSQIKSVAFGSVVQPTSMAHWFQDCQNLESIDWTNFDGSNVTSIRALFPSTALTSITLPPMPNLENMRFVFQSCTSLTSVDFSQIGSSKISNMSAMFQGASAIEVINLKGVTGTVLECQNMFSNASAGAPATNIKTIYVELDLDFSQATNSTAMFRGCTQLVGGQGTTYDSTKTDKEYARVDAPMYGMPGYFSVAV